MPNRLPARIAYVGPNMDLAMAAYLPSHRELGHVVEFYVSPDHVPMDLKPDVVVIAPLVTRNGRIEGACLMSTIVPESTLIVALATAEGHSHAMYFKHALGGHCHERVLLHHPRPGFTASEFVGCIDVAVRKRGAITESMCGIPDYNELKAAGKDLGELIEELNMLEFLYVAATDPGWTTWNELANLLGYGSGHVRNRVSAFGKKAAEAGLIQRTEKFRIGQFVRFVTEHRSFIKAHAQHHGRDLHKPQNDAA